MELTHITGSTYCTDIHGTCTGLYLAGNNQVIMIDSGRYESEELFDWLNDNGLRVCAIIHTHLHVDHIANSAALREMYGAVLYSSEPEPFEYYVEFETEHNPCKGSLTINIPGVGVCSNIPGAGDCSFEIIPTPGHSAGHQMVVTPDGVGFAGDAILSEDFLDKTILPYMDHIKQSICSMKVIERADLYACVCSHNGIIPGPDIEKVVNLNIQKEICLFELLEETLDRPMSRSLLADLFMKKAGIYNAQIRQYDYMIDTVYFRIDELIEDGHFIEKDGLIFPAGQG